MRRPRFRREWLLPLAAACLAASALLAALAVDVARWRTGLPADDVRFRTAEPAAGLWQPRRLVPLAAADRLLGIRDDLAFREMLRDLRASRIRSAIVSDAGLALVRTATADELSAIATHDPDPRLRSRASTILGVLSVIAWTSLPSAGETERDRTELLLGAIADFEEAVALDPGNDDAKFNLQVLLQRAEGLIPTEASAGKNPLPGGRGSRGAGAGSAGGGY